MLLNKSYFQAIAICVLALIQIPAVSSIVGGADGVQADLKYVVKVTINGVYACGGAIVSITHVVTVYHCVLGVHKTRVKVEGGTIESEVDPANLLDVAEIYRSPHFNPFTRYMDIAVLKLATAVTFPTMGPVLLRKGGWDYKLPIHISGWGLKANGEPATVLQTAQVKGIPNSECESALGGSKLPATLFCSATSGPAKTSKGDDGAPAVLGGILVGIAAVVDSINMFTAIPPIMNFLNQATEF